MGYEDQQWSSDEQYDNRNKRKYDGDDDQSNKKQRSEGFEVIVKNLDFNVNEDSLTEFFEKCGTIEEVKIPRKPTGESRGYGFVKFDSQEAVDEAIKLTNEEFEGRQVTVALSSKSGGGNDREEKNNIFVGNLSYDTTEDGLADLFGSCGNITAVRMPTDEHTGRKKGFAFVDFDSAEAVEKAMEMNDAELDGRNIRVDKGGQKKQGGGFRGGRGGGFGGRGGRGGGFRGGRGGGFGDRGGRGGGRGRGGGFRGGRGGGGGFRGGFGGGSDFQGKRKTF